ncbi:MAG: 4Fe-4S dicluster domain-containing protein [Chloroflexi bacterium]|nr:4Fe-4S dicluster domain-containing protein [Chloroflexota bacterium]
MLSVIERFASIDGPAIVFDPGRCLRARDRFSTCDLCAARCPAGAVRIGEGGATFDPAACALCGLCLHLCPVGAFAGDTGANDILRCAAQIDDLNALELICPAHPEPATGPAGIDAAIAPAGCLASLGPSAYASLAACGIPRVAVRLDACAACPLGQVAADVRQAIDRARRVLAAWDLAGSVDIVAEGPLEDGQPRPVYPANRPPVSRRDLFRRFTSAPARTIDEALLVDEGPSPARNRLPPERRRLLNALDRLPPPIPTAICPAPEPGQAFVLLGVDDTCTACGVCAKACPTGALQVLYDDESRGFEILYAPRACTGCETCLHICDPEALHRRRVPLFREFLAAEPGRIHSGVFHVCEACGARFAGEPSARGLCPPCDFRRQNPFGYKIPPRLERHREVDQD